MRASTMRSERGVNAARRRIGSRQRSRNGIVSRATTTIAAATSHAARNRIRGRENVLASGPALDGMLAAFIVMPPPTRLLPSSREERRPSSVFHTATVRPVNKPPATHAIDHLRIGSKEPSRIHIDCLAEDFFKSYADLVSDSGWR